MEHKAAKEGNTPRMIVRAPQARDESKQKHSRDLFRIFQAVPCCSLLLRHQKHPTDEMIRNLYYIMQMTNRATPLDYNLFPRIFVSLPEAASIHFKISV